MDVPRPFPLAVAAAGAAWIPPILFGLRWPEYRAARDFISELGASGAPDATLVNASFLVAGLLFVVACTALARHEGGARSATRLALVSLAGWSYVAAAAIPCDSGCPAQGSAAQALHNAIGGLGYLGCALGLLLAAGRRRGPHAPRWLSMVTGSLALACVLGMGSPDLADVRGALQRLAEGGIFAWLLVEASMLGNAAAHDARQRRHI